MGRQTPIRRELLLAFGVMFAGGIFMASVGIALLLPVMYTLGEAVLYIFALMLADLLVIFFFGRLILGRTLLKPLDRLVEDVQKIASGSFGHRIRPVSTLELQAVADSGNALAERLIKDQEHLAENVRSLNETNLALVEARAQVVRAARLASTGTLASGIAHELGNPLGALLSYVDVARSRSTADGEDTEILDSMREEAVRMDRIIRSLLDFARSGEGETDRREPLAVVERVRSLLEAQGKLDDIEMTWEVTKEEIPDVLMDAQRLEQVLVNLILNALDAVSEEDPGRIKVSLGVAPGPASLLPRRRKGDPPRVDYAHRRRIVSAEDGVRVAPLANSFRIVVLTVEDNGTGLAAETLEEIFDPFFTTKEPGQGTGLGLALSTQLVEGMGGEIEAGNREVGGAVFTLRLPEADWAIGGNNPEAVEGSDSALPGRSLKGSGN